MVGAKKLLSMLVLAGAVAGAPVVLAAPSASAAFAVTGTGTVACTGVTGTVRFDPSVTLLGGQVSATVKIVLHGCSAAGSNVTSSDFKGKGRGTLQVEGGGTNCASLAGDSPPFQLVGTISVRWTGRVARRPGKAPYHIDPTTVTVTTMTSTGAASNGNLGLDFARQQLSGSFSSAASTLSGELDSTRPPSKVVCGGKRVVRKLNIAAGKVDQP
jgi:hypothetical protein